MSTSNEYHEIHRLIYDARNLAGESPPGTLNESVEKLLDAVAMLACRCETIEHDLSGTLDVMHDAFKAPAAKGAEG